MPTNYNQLLKDLEIIRKSPYSLFMKSMILLINSSIVQFLF